MSQVQNKVGQISIHDNKLYSDGGIPSMMASMKLCNHDRHFTEYQGEPPGYLTSLTIASVYSTTVTPPCEPNSDRIMITVLPIQGRAEQPLYGQRMLLFNIIYPHVTSLSNERLLTRSDLSPSLCIRFPGGSVQPTWLE